MHLSFYMSYTLSVKDGEHYRPFYSGATMVAEFGNMTDARAHEVASRLFVNGHPAIMAMETGRFSTMNEAIDSARTIANAQNIPYHIGLNGNKSRLKGAVKCLNDGRVFETAADACRYYKIGSGNLTKHLRRERSYKSVKGKVFEYVERNDQ